MRLPFMLLAIAVAATALAGCSSSPNPSPSPSPQAETGWQVDCLQGGYSQLQDASWAQRCEARASHTEGAKQEMWLAVNPADPNNVVVAAKDLNPDSSPGCVWNGLGVTHDGGKTWKDVVIGGKYADRTPTDPFYGYACNTDPDFRFTSDGALHYGVEMYNVGNNGPCLNPDGSGLTCLTPGFKVLLATSRDGGDTFPDVITFLPDLGVVSDFSRMTVNPKTQSVVEAIGSLGPLALAGPGCAVLRSTDSGKSAQPPVFVATQDGVPCGSSGDTAIAGSPDGTLVLVGGAFTTAPNGGLSGNDVQPIVVRSTDDGLIWTDSNAGFTFKPIPGQFSESDYRITNNVELAYDLSGGAHRGTLYATYAASDRDDADIYVVASTDDGKTWSAPVLVNSDPAGTHQWMPNVAVAGDGSVHVVFMDKSQDPNGTLISMTHAFSLDGGKTWTSQTLSTVPYDGNLGRHQEGFAFIGDYLGLDCVKTDCWAGFPDASNGKMTVMATAHMHLV